MMMRFFTATRLIGVVSLASAALQPRQAANPSVTLSDGVVIGTATGVLNQPSNTGRVNAYLGVPFANSPPLRFAPPTAPEPWSTPLVAQTLPPACLQQFPPGAAGETTRFLLNNPGNAPPLESEDCLYLNVFAPRDASPSNLKSVLFWMYGGNNNFGTASLAYYNGSSLAVNEDVVVVVINYRMNIFGFSNSPQIPREQQNSGYLDQRFALQWVQNNIRQFGGDPAKVTIFGESAGGYAVKQLLANPPDPLPFRAAILQSQQLAAIGSGRSSYNQVLSRFGCVFNVSPLDCIRQVPGTEILQFISERGLVFPPVADSTFVGSNSLPSIRSGRFANVPILIGTNLDEANLFLEIFGLTDLLGFQNTFDIDISNITSEVQARYAEQGVNPGLALLNRIGTDLLFTCTTRSFSNAVNRAGRQPVWRYRYDASFPNLEFDRNLGAYHSSEIPSVFGTYPLENEFGPATAEQIELASFTQRAWANFAKDPSAGPGWPRLGSAGGRELALIGGKGDPIGEETVNLFVADYACPIFEPLLILLGLAF